MWNGAQIKYNENGYRWEKSNQEIEKCSVNCKHQQKLILCKGQLSF